MEVTEINVYPIKSCKGVSVKKWKIGKFGFEYDRNWVIADGKNNGRFITQRQVPKFALITPTIDDKFLTLDAPGMSSFKIPLDAKDQRLVPVSVWSSDMEGMDEGDQVASWLQKFLDDNRYEFRLIRTKRDHDRKVPDKYSVNSPTVANMVNFQDAFPFLVISQESLQDLNKKIQSETLPMNRFRPNIVIKGAPYPFAEDDLGAFQIGDTKLHAVKKCTRCKLTTVDQSKGEFKNEEPLKTLHMYREGLLEGKSEVCFGQNLIHENYNTELSVGQILRVL